MELAKSDNKPLHERLILPPKLRNETKQIIFIFVSLFRKRTRDWEISSMSVRTILGGSFKTSMYCRIIYETTLFLL